MGDVRNNEALREVEIRMRHMIADIVCIQETHNTRTEDKPAGNYRYMPTAAPKTKTNGSENEKGIIGAAILIIKNGVAAS